MKGPRIDEIEICDFKGFPEDRTPPITLGGKSLLLYGENGSGKSTIFHALKHLFDPYRSRPFDDDISDEGSLKHRYSDKSSTKGKVRLSFSGVDQAAVEDLVWKIEPRSDATTKEPPHTRPDTHPLYIGIARASGFLDYRDLLRAHMRWEFDFGDSEQPNLFHVLRRMLDDTEAPGQKGEAAPPTFRERHEKLTDAWEQWSERSLPDFDELDEFQRDRIGLVNYRAEEEDEEDYDEKAAYERYRASAPKALTQQFDEYRDALESAVAKIEKDANAFLKVMEPGLTVALRWGSRFGFSFSDHPSTLDPKLHLSAVFRDRPVLEPGLFLNEARLSALGLVFYLAALRMKAPEAATSPRLLVLDDVLIGLDMAHRRPVLDLLERHFSKKWQIVLMTFDRAWFEVGKQRLDSERWCWHEVYTVRVGDFEMPVLGEDHDHLEKARRYLDPQMGGTVPDVKAAAVHVRTKFERVAKAACITFQLPVKYSAEPHKTSAKEFWSAACQATYERARPPKASWDEQRKQMYAAKAPKETVRLIDVQLARRVELAVSWVLNPLSHSEDVAQYRKEIKEAIDVIGELELQFAAVEALKVGVGSTPRRPSNPTRETLARRKALAPFEGLARAKPRLTWLGYFAWILAALYRSSHRPGMTLPIIWHYFVARYFGMKWWHFFSYKLGAWLLAALSFTRAIADGIKFVVPEIYVRSGSRDPLSAITKLRVRLLKKRVLISMNLFYRIVSTCLVVGLAVLPGSLTAQGYASHPLASSTLVLLLFLYGFSRANEVFYAFGGDAIRIAEGHQATSALRRDDRIKLALWSYFSLLLDFGIIYFVFRDGFAPGKVEDIWDALYFSGVTIPTLGYGDISPEAPLVRLLSLYQVACGIALLVLSFTIYVGSEPKQTAARHDSA